MRDNPTLEEMAAALEASGDYKFLRRLAARPITMAPVDAAHKTGVILDVETTGLDHRVDEIVELGMVRFSYSEADEVTAVLDGVDFTRRLGGPAVFACRARVLCAFGLTGRLRIGLRFFFFLAMSGKL